MTSLRIRQLGLPHRTTPFRIAAYRAPWKSGIIRPIPTAQQARTFRTSGHRSQTAGTQDSYTPATFTRISRSGSGRNVLLSAFKGAVFFVLLRQLLYVLYESDGEIPEDSAAELREILDNSEEANGSWFLPLEFPREVVPRKFYAHSDPEWQEFIHLSRDHDRTKNLRASVATRCLEELNYIPQVTKLLGKNRRVSSHWLEMKYPNSPPPEYERFGIGWEEEGWSLSKQVMSHSEYVKLRHLLYPQGVFVAAYKSVAVFTRLQMVKIKTSLGLKLTTDERNTRAVREYFLAHSARAGDAMDTSLGDESETMESQIETSEDDPSSADEDAAQRRGSLRDSDDQVSIEVGDDIFSRVLQNSINLLDPSSQYYPFDNIDMALAQTVFWTVLREKWKEAERDLQPKGSCWVVGQVELRGDTGKMKCEVLAVYNPKSDNISHCSIQVLHYWEARQRAKGGP